MYEFVFWIFLIGTPHAVADGATTGKDGGQGVICRSGVRMVHGDRLLPSLELLDLYEARRQFPDYVWSRGAEIGIGDQVLRRSFRGQVHKIIRKHESKVADVLGDRHQLRAVFQRAQDLIMSARLEDDIQDTNDHVSIAVDLRDRCRLVQIANRENISGKSIVSLHFEYVQLMTETEIAALLFHESLHDFGPSTGSNVLKRQLVAFAFGQRRFMRENLPRFRWLIDAVQQNKKDRHH